MAWTASRRYGVGLGRMRRPAGQEAALGWNGSWSLAAQGRGKHFCRALQGATGLPLYYLDQLFHLPDGSHVSQADFDEGLAAILKAPDGSLMEITSAH